jgi:DNA-binding MarR family transcriptional regulator
MTDLLHTAQRSPAKLKYLDFLLAVYAANDSDHKRLVIPPEEQRLLELIAVRYAMNQPLSMMQALASRDTLFLSPSSVSRKLDNLQDADLIHVVVDPVDRRMKFIQPSEKALAHFAYLESLLPTSAVS